jgi:hypothetical protein
MTDGIRARLCDISDGHTFDGLIPPFLVRASGPGGLPGVDLGVEWRLRHHWIGELGWSQEFVDGVEVQGRTSEKAPRIQLCLSYRAMMDVCYEGLPFESVLAENELLHNVAALSCLTGLLHLPGALRLDMLSDRDYQILGQWSEGDPSVVVLE